ncbi:MFS transporter [Natrarchaeobius sp. A-rgal3]|uniref:MFS transporter n=1 Tax=Natrarchaeobius versutus TaxID=1679078 RepID=UPI00350F06BC
MSDGTTVSDVVDDLSTGPFHRRLLLITGCALCFTAVEILSISFVLPVLIDSWSLSGLAAGLLGSSALVGIMFGSWFGGWYADRVGRVSGLQWAVLCYSLFAGLTALSLGFYSLFVFRLLTGFGVGWATTITVSYLSEHLPTRNRGRYIVYFEVFWPIGTILAVVLAWLCLDVLATDGTILGVASWRFVFVGASLPAFLVLVIRRLEETPYYLASSDRLDDANERIRDIAGENGGSPSAITATRSDRGDSASFARLFSPGLRRRTILASLSWFGINFGFYGIFIWLPDTLEAANVGGDLYGQLFLVAIAQLPGILSAAYLIDRIGRTYTIGGYLLLAGVFTFTFAAELAGWSIVGLDAVHPLLSLFFASFFLIGAWGPMLAYTAELFPTEVRATGFGFASGIGKIASISGPIVAGLLVTWGYFVALAPFAIGMAAGAILILAMGTETKDVSLR